MKNASIKAAAYPYNLLQEISDDCGEFPKDINQTVAYVVAGLTEREQDIIHKRYKECKTYEQIGKDFNVTRERVRQIEAKAIRKLRHPHNVRMLKCGFVGRAMDARDAAFKKAMVAEMSKICFAILDVKESLDKDILPAPKCQTAKCRDDSDGLDDIPLSDLDLSCRTYNCLQRANARTLKDVAAMTEEELLRVRNLGRKSFEEIVSKLHQHGLGLKGCKNEEV